MQKHLLTLSIVVLQLLAIPTLAQWTTIPLSLTGFSPNRLNEPAANAVGSKAIFAGGVVTYQSLSGPRTSSLVTIYDDATGQVTSSELSIGRTQLGAGSVGNLAFFAGGRSGGPIVFNNNSARVDIYNSSTNQWSLAELSQARANMGVASAGSKILFAGGASYGFGYVSGPNPYLGIVPTNYNTVDIYDTATNQWSVSQLPRVSGEYLAAVSVGNQIWFAQKGLLDIYNVSTGQWLADSIPLQNNNYSVTRAGNKILFVGRDNPGSSKVAIYHVVTGQWSESNLSQVRSQLTAVSLGNKAFFAGQGSASIDVYDATTNQWSILNFPRSIGESIAATPVSNKLLFSGDGPLEINIYTEAASSNTAPSTTGLANQTIITGQSVQLDVAPAFSDDETPGSLTFTATGLPTGLSLTGSVISGSTSLTGIATVTIRATDPGSLSISTQFTLTVLPTSSTSSPLQLVMPLYNCQTGAFHFNTSGGDGTPIEYYAVPGITGWTTNPDQFVDQETRTAADAQPITLRARQSGKEVSLLWDIRAQCPIGNTTSLRLIAPSYSCSSGAFTFQTTGGDGSAIEFMAIGITGWTTNPNQFVDRETRTAADAPVITLRARQNGSVVSYDWNIRSVCPIGSFRVGTVVESAAGLQVRVLGNPIKEANAELEIEGAEGQPLLIQAFSESGRLINSHQLERASASQRQQIDVGKSSGSVLLLRVTTPTQSKTVKVIKQ
jgi:hypothetical protein